VVPDTNVNLPFELFGTPQLLITSVRGDTNILMLQEVTFPLISRRHQLKHKLQSPLLTSRFNFSSELLRLSLSSGFGWLNHPKLKVSGRIFPCMARTSNIKIRFLCTAYNCLPFNSEELKVKLDFRFSRLQVRTIKMVAFWYIAPCSLVYVDRRFRNAYCLLSLGRFLITEKI
jgi:hypothetical protein